MQFIALWRDVGAASPDLTLWYCEKNENTNLEFLDAAR